MVQRLQAGTQMPAFSAAPRLRVRLEWRLAQGAVPGSVP